MRQLAATANPSAAISPTHRAPLVARADKLVGGCEHALTALAASRATDVYVYKFARVSPLNRSTFGGAGHGTEIPYIFGHITADESGYEEVDLTVSRAMAGAWVQFAKTGTPNGASLPEWPAYAAPGYRVLKYGDAITVTPNPDRAGIDFFERAIETMRQRQ